MPSWKREDVEATRTRAEKLKVNRDWRFHLRLGIAEQGTVDLAPLVSLLRLKKAMLTGGWDAVQAWRKDARSASGGLFPLRVNARW